MLDLEIFSSGKIKILILAKISKITCTVKSCVSCFARNCSCDKSSSRFLFVVIITISQRLTGNTDFTGLTGFCDVCSRLIKKK